MAEEPKSAETAKPRGVLLFRNASANLLRALSSSALMVLLPVFLVVIFEPGRYAVWALVFSLSTFAAYFDLGLPTTVQAVVGRAMSLDDRRTAGKAVSSGLGIVGLVGCACIVASLVAAHQFTALFPAIPASLRLAGSWALVFLVFGQTASLVGNVVSAYFSGQQRSHVAAAITAPGRASSLTFAVAAAYLTRDLAVTAIFYSVPLVAASLVLLLRFGAEHARQARVRITESEDPTVTKRGLLSYSGPLMVWSICMLITTGLDLTIVARVDFGSVVPYSIAAIVVSAVAGLQSATSGPLLPELARTHALKGAGSVSLLAERFNRLNGVLLFGATAGLLLGAPLYLPILTHDPDVGAPEPWTILALLLAGNAFHLAGTPLSLTFIATKTHARVIAPPVIEALLNLALSLIFGLVLGAVGVAAGTLVASAVGICLGYFWSTRVSGIIRTAPLALLRQGVLQPLICVLPALGAAYYAVIRPDGSSLPTVIVPSLAALLSCGLLWFLGLDRKTRGQIVRTIKRLG